MLAPLKTAKKSVAKAILKPLAVAFLVLLVLASMKLLLFAMVRAAREREAYHEVPAMSEAQRDRWHAQDARDQIAERV